MLQKDKTMKAARGVGKLPEMFGGSLGVGGDYSGLAYRGYCGRKCSSDHRQFFINFQNMKTSRNDANSLINRA